MSLPLRTTVVPPEIILEIFRGDKIMDWSKMKYFTIPIMGPPQRPIITITTANYFNNEFFTVDEEDLYK